MSTILICRDEHRKPSVEALLEQQAILAITRAVLARPSENRMHLSEHKLLVPAHLDILPLLALAANDYAQFVEPEADHLRERSPMMLYHDDSAAESLESHEMTRRFMHPRWFNDQGPVRFHKLIFDHRPDVCVVLGQVSSIMEKMGDIDYRFPSCVCFSTLMHDHADQRDMLGRIARRVTMADEFMAEHLQTAARRMDIQGDPMHKGMWSQMYVDENGKRAEHSLPRLEPFVAFGTAIEMALFSPK
ncbi:MAG TPA: hypothetical protein PLR25_25125 [Planctomycetaceae bacterium]|nr:hypothetical protein [Planctomycetaceae bacterium]